MSKHIIELGDHGPFALTMNTKSGKVKAKADDVTLSCHFDDTINHGETYPPLYEAGRRFANVIEDHEENCPCRSGDDLPDGIKELVESLGDLATVEEVSEEDVPAEMLAEMREAGVTKDTHRIKVVKVDLSELMKNPSAVPGGMSAIADLLRGAQAPSKD